MAKGFGKSEAFDIKTFVQDRDAALLSLDKAQIEAYAKKHQVELPNDEETFWAYVHKARCELVNLPDEARSYSRGWLESRGYFPGFKY